MKEELTNRMIIVACLVAVLALSFMMTMHGFDDNDRDIQIQTDMIAACSASTDVVGCLNAVTD